ncbi:MAG: ABC transporter ATP-binding protein, partial [Acidimicrobiales bacterium]
MGWGGGGGAFGGGGMGGRPGGSPGNPGNGLPFAGIPPELQDGVDKLLKTEADYPEPKARFSYQLNASERRRMTLRQLVLQHWRLGLFAVGLVTVVSLANQAGPELIDHAVNNMIGPHRTYNTILVCGILFLVAIAVSAIAQHRQVRTTGRLAARVMNDLRVKVFTHLQRMSLDFYTDEKAGV